mmetsp:Transcript_18395/g.58466  ORF Transcript_18395/g.58466 Transcript_18395/m.58466 type:complete len:554 (-) Transcript_18395:83-1744(-)
MIYYDSHKWRSLAKIRGSVLPKAMLWAVPSMLLAIGLKLAEDADFINLENLEVLSQGDVYSGFTFVLGFSLVFRTSQSYTRYWTAATSVHEMGSQWSDSCGSLIAFSSISRAPQKDILSFRHTVVRLFSILHAMALEEIASVSGDFPLIDIDGFRSEDLKVLTTNMAQGRKIQIVLCWIKSYITKAAHMGVLNVPAPILTRVFQELGSGLVNYHSAQQVVIWPFPFPYTQLNFLLIFVYIAVTPLVISTWRTEIWLVAMFTFISVTCMMGLDLIASELENPFGDDPNDLPVFDMQRDMNKMLLMQLHAASLPPPELLPSACMDYEELADQTTGERKSLQQKLGRSGSASLSVSARHTLVSGNRGDRLMAQLRWSGQASCEGEAKRVHEWLKSQSRISSALSVPSGLASASVALSNGTDSQASLCSEARQPPERQPLPAAPGEAEVYGRKEVLSAAANHELPEAPSVATAALPIDHNQQWAEFLRGLRVELREHLGRQLDIQERELAAIEELLGRPPPVRPPPARGVLLPMGATGPRVPSVIAEQVEEEMLVES